MDCQSGKQFPALRVLEMQMGDRALLVDASSGALQPLVPAAFWWQIFLAIHEVAHPGIRATIAVCVARAHRRCEKVV
jgi:hypothetical protein